MNSRICKKKTPSFSEHLLFSNRTTWAIKKANLSLPVTSIFLTKKGPNDGNQHCRKKIGDLDSFAPNEVDPNTENEAGADQ